MDEVRIVPRRIFRVTFTTSEGRKVWRYVRCPYQVKGPEMVRDGEVERFTVSALAPERTNAAAKKSMRWHEVLALVA